MPQIVAVVLIGAGIAAGMKWLTREMASVAEAARMAHEQMARANPSTRPGPRRARVGR